MSNWIYKGRKVYCRVCGQDNTYYPISNCLMNHRDFYYTERDGQLIFEFAL